MASNYGTYQGQFGKTDMLRKALVRKSGEPNATGNSDEQQRLGVDTRP
jgi:hypothetical protein